MPATPAAPTAPTAPAAAAPAGAARPSLTTQGAALGRRLLDAQKAVSLTWLDLYDRNAKVVLGAGEKLADKAPSGWAADTLRRQNEFAGRLSVAYSDAVRAYLA